MRKDRDWVDYANLGINYAQLSQAREIKNSLDQMRSLEAERLRQDRWDASRSEREDRLREAVFQGEDTLEGCHYHLESRPLGVLALALELTGNFQKYGFTTASFRAFEDKDRLRKLLKGMEEVIEQSRKRLTSSEQAEAGACVRYRIEMEALRDLMAYRQKHEQLTAVKESRAHQMEELANARTELQKAQAELHSAESGKYPVVGCVLNLAMLCGLGILIYGVWQRSFMFGIMSVLTFLGASVGIAKNQKPFEAQIRQSSTKVKESDAHVQKLNEQFKELELNIGRAQEQLRVEFPGERLVELDRLFPEPLSSEACKKVYDERMVLINRVLAEPEK